jgi:hypothetical protein
MHTPTARVVSLIILGAGAASVGAGGGGAMHTPTARVVSFILGAGAASVGAGGGGAMQCTRYTYCTYTCTCRVFWRAAVALATAHTEHITNTHTHV